MTKNYENFNEVGQGQGLGQMTDQTQADDTGAGVQMRNKPKLIISGYELSPKMVEAGEDFDLSINLYNTNNENTIYNLKISLDQNLQAQPQGAPGENNALVSDGSIFTPVDSSNTFYTAAIYPWNYTTKNIRMNVLPNAKAGSYVMGVNLEYEDYLGNQYTTTEYIGIPVVQKARVTTGEINIEDQLIQGQPTAVSMNIYNTGKDNLSTFIMKVDGEGFSVDEATHFIGNFAAGAQDTFSFNITPEKEGKINGKITIAYEDSTGKGHVEEKKFSKQVEAMGEDQMLDENGNPITTDPETGEMIGGENPSPSLAKPILTGLGLLVLVIIIVALVKKRRKKKKDEELTIDED